MSCFHPLKAFRGRNGGVTFNSHSSLTGVSFPLPCGKCQGCRLEHSRIWAIRCMHESKMHEDNVFVTFTYDNANLPSNGTLVLRDFQLFFKRLRKYLKGRKVRYYGCGEYGDEFKRPHYHAILFGIDFPDKRFFSENASGDKIFTSAVLDDLWSLGHCRIGSVTFDSCAYVARYCMKKVDGAKREAGHYEVYDADGLLSERKPEFAVMSRRPGIGMPYYLKYGAEIRNHDKIIVSGKAVPSIRYYDLKFEALDPEWFERVKKKRVRVASIDAHVARLREGSPERLDVKERLLLQRMKQKKRSM